MSAIGSIPPVYSNEYLNDYTEYEEVISRDPITGEVTDSCKYYKRGNGAVFGTVEAYKDAVRSWASSRNRCAELAEKVLACQDLEVSTALVYTLFSEVYESLDFTSGQLTLAVDELSPLTESAIQGAIPMINSIVEEISPSQQMCTEGQSVLDNVSNAIKKVGQRL